MKLTPKPGIKSFANVQIGELFRGLRPENIKNGQELREGKWVARWRSVPSDGLYVKTGSCICADIAHNNKDTIFNMKMPCRVLDRQIDSHKLESYSVYHRNQPTS